jgi:hypothetical protein
MQIPAKSVISILNTGKIEIRRQRQVVAVFLACWQWSDPRWGMFLSWRAPGVEDAVKKDRHLIKKCETKALSLKGLKIVLKKTCQSNLF